MDHDHPYFQVALNRDLEQDTARREKAMKVLNVMLSEQAQNRIVSEGQDILSYSQNVPLRLTEYLKDVRSVVEDIAVEVKENNGSYTLTGITRNGQPLGDNDTVTVTCLATEKSRWKRCLRAIAARLLAKIRG